MSNKKIKNQIRKKLNNKNSDEIRWYYDIDNIYIYIYIFNASIIIIQKINLKVIYFF